MSGQLVFSLIGDSNVRRHMNSTNSRAHPAMSSTQVILCNRLEILSSSLRNVKRESNVCILSCVTNFLTSSEATSSTVSHRVDTVLDEFFSMILTECEANPSRHYLIAPPMYRQTPLWYRDGLPEVLSRFSASSKRHCHSGLALLPSFSTPTFEADGVHLTAYSGLEFVLHLFDSSKLLIDNLSAPDPVRESAALEANRLLEDRVVALEQDHRRLNNSFELKTAVYAEAEDFRCNERMEDSFIVSGINPVQGRCSGKEWQDRAQSIVQDVIRKIMGESMPILVVRNATGVGTNAPVTYNVQMVRRDDACSIRKKFGSFFARGSDTRPQELSQVSVQNAITKGTRVRISILKLIAKRYVESNPEGKANVVGYTSRPMLKVTPPPSGSDRVQRVRSYTYIEAIQKFPTNFAEADIGPITKRAFSSFPHQLRSTFAVLSDDFPGLGSRPARSKRAASPAVGTGRRARVEPDELDDDAVA